MHSFAIRSSATGRNFEAAIDESIGWFSLDEDSVSKRAHVQGRTEAEVALPLHTRLTAVGELHSTSRDAAAALGSIRCRDGQVLALRVMHPTHLQEQCLPAYHGSALPHYCRVLCTMPVAQMPC